MKKTFPKWFKFDSKTKIQNICHTRLKLDILYLREPFHVQQRGE